MVSLTYRTLHTQTHLKERMISPYRRPLCIWSQNAIWVTVYCTNHKSRKYALTFPCDSNLYTTYRIKYNKLGCFRSVPPGFFCWMGLQTLMENKANYMIFWGACNVSKKKKKKNLASSQCIQPKPASIYVSCTWSTAITGSYYMCHQNFSEKSCAWNFTNSLSFPQIKAYKNTAEAAFLAAIKPGEMLKESVIKYNPFSFSFKYSVFYCFCLHLETIFLLEGKIAMPSGQILDQTIHQTLKSSTTFSQ